MVRKYFKYNKTGKILNKTGKILNGTGVMGQVFDHYVWPTFLLKE